MSEPLVREINELNFDAEVIEPKSLFLLEFGTVWCSPCRALEPIVAALASELQDQLRVGKVDGDGSPALGAQLNVRAFPTLIVFVDGKERGRRVGMTSRKGVLELLGLKLQRVA